MPSIPRVFISATSRDLESYRKAVAEVLPKRDWQPVSQDHFPPDYRTVQEVLRAKISTCDAVICLIGHRFGQEPRNLQPGKPRRSYTQMEYDIAQQLGKPIFRFLATKDCPIDHPDDPPEDDNCASLQLAFRQQIQSSDYLRHSFNSVDNLLQQVRDIQLPRPVSQGVRLTAMVAVLCVLVLAGFFGQRWLLYDDPCSKKNELLLSIPDEEVSNTLLKIALEKPFVETSEKPQQPLTPGRKECHLRVINETGRPVRIWRYFPNSEGPANSKDVSSSSSVERESKNDSYASSFDPKAHRPWRTITACGASSQKVPAIGGWSYFFVEDLQESLKEARSRTSDPDDGGPFSWFRPVMIGWDYLPYERDSLIKIKKGFFNDQRDPTDFVVLTEQ